MILRIEAYRTCVPRDGVSQKAAALHCCSGRTTTHPCRAVHDATDPDLYRAGDKRTAMSRACIAENGRRRIGRSSA